MRSCGSSAGDRSGKRTTFSRRRETSSSALCSFARSAFTCSVMELHCGRRRSERTRWRFVAGAPDGTAPKDQLLPRLIVRRAQPRRGCPRIRNDAQPARLNASQKKAVTAQRKRRVATGRGDGPGPAAPLSGAPWPQRSLPLPARVSRGPPCELARVEPSGGGERTTGKDSHRHRLVCTCEAHTGS